MVTVTAWHKKQRLDRFKKIYIHNVSLLFFFSRQKTFFQVKGDFANLKNLLPGDFSNHVGSKSNAQNFAISMQQVLTRSLRVHVVYIKEE